MFYRSSGLGKMLAPQTRPAHHFDDLTDFCTQCGAHRSSVWLAEWPARCPAETNVIGISHLLARRYLAYETHSGGVGRPESAEPPSVPDGSPDEHRPTDHAVVVFRTPASI